MNKTYLELFEAGVDRKGTDCVKWDGCLQRFGRADILPLWVADMDFAAPQAVTEALTARAAQGVFGYPVHDLTQDSRAVCDWMRARHGLDIAPEAVLFSPGVVDSLLYALRAVTQPGDLVAVQTPVYGPFYRAVDLAGCRLYRNPLRQTPAGWEMDLDNLEAGLRAGVRAVLLCNPHNPVGRVWTRAELDALCALCARYDARLVCDEIHSDLILPGYVHIPILAIDPRAIQLCSATKTFNLAGLRCSSVLVPDADTRAAVEAELRDCGVGEINLFGLLAQTTAYREGAPWLDALCEYLAGSRDLMCDFLRERVPQLVPSRLEGTYLAWLDARALGMDDAALTRFLVEKAGVGLNSGDFFGEEGAGFVRLNLATPRRILARALAQIEEAVNAL